MMTNPMTCWLTHKSQPPRPALVTRDVCRAGPPALGGPGNYSSAVTLLQRRECLLPASHSPSRDRGSGARRLRSTAGALSSSDVQDTRAVSQRCAQRPAVRPNSGRPCARPSWTPAHRVVARPRGDGARPLEWRTSGEAACTSTSPRRQPGPSPRLPSRSRDRGHRPLSP